MNKGSSLAELYPELAARMLSSSPFPATSLTVGTKKEIHVLCETCGGVRMAPPESFIKGRKCAYCCGQKVLRGYNDLATVNPKIAATITEDSPLQAHEVTGKSSRIVKARCGRCGFVRVIKVLKLAMNDCGACANKVLVKGINDLATTHPALARKISSHSPIKASEVTYGSNQKVEICCDNCSHGFSAPVKNITATVLCSLCRQRYSKLEFVVAKFFREECFSLKVLHNRRPLKNMRGERYEIDFLLPELKIGFEVQDFATHSRASDSEKLTGKWASMAERTGGSLYKKGPAYHETKRMLAKAQLKVALYDLWEDEILAGAYKEKIRTIIASAHA